MVFSNKYDDDHDEDLSNFSFTKSKIKNCNTDQGKNPYTYPDRWAWFLTLPLPPRFPELNIIRIMEVSNTFVNLEDS